MSELYRSKYEAYPFLSDPTDDLRCDFEILTDELSSMIGLLKSTVSDVDTNTNLLKICELVYHLNPSLRTFVSVTQEEIDWLVQETHKLESEVKHRFEKFVLTQGCQNACQSHIIRSRFKALVRMLYRAVHNGDNVPEAVIDIANLLSGYFFLLALKLNELEGVDEVEYVSRNYK